MVRHERLNPDTFETIEDGSADRQRRMQTYSNEQSQQGYGWYHTRREPEKSHLEFTCTPLKQGGVPSRHIFT